MEIGAKVLSIDGIVRGVFTDDIDLLSAVMKNTNYVVGDTIETNANLAVTKHGDKTVRIEWFALNEVKE